MKANKETVDFAETRRRSVANALEEEDGSYPATKRTKRKP